MKTKGRTGKGRRRRERAIRIPFFCIALASITMLALIVIFLFTEGLPIFAKISVKKFIFGKAWYPTDDPPDFGIFPLIVASLSVIAAASMISIPLGVLSALYLAEVASARLRELVKPVVELLAALPSVVIGFFGMVIVAPILQDLFNHAMGLNLFNASLMLAFMSIPTIFSVPAELKEAFLSLSTTHWETIWRVIVPVSISGISTTVILGMSRAMGETMVVFMVAGAAAMAPGSLFDPVRPMPASIAVEMAEGPFARRTLLRPVCNRNRVVSLYPGL